MPLSFPPGERFAYNNTNYLVLALIVEKVSGESYHDYVREHVLDPAGMHDTSPVLAFADYRVLQEGTDFAGAYWYPHFWYSDELLEPDRIPFYAHYWSTYAFQGFSDYRTTLRDLLRFDQALYDGRLLGESTLEEAFTPAKLNDGTPSPSGYGLGWEIDESEPFGKLVHHSGGMMGFSCDLLRNVTKHQTIVLYVNTLPDNYTFVIDRVALRILNGGAPIRRARASRASSARRSWRRGWTRRWRRWSGSSATPTTSSTRTSSTRSATTSWTTRSTSTCLSSTAIPRPSRCWR